MKATSKAKSKMRFEQINGLCDRVIRTLPARHGLALIVCWRHAREQGRFRVSHRRMAETLGVDVRTAQRIFKDLERWGCIQEVAPEKGTTPRTLRITGRRRRVGTSVA